MEEGSVFSALILKLRIGQTQALYPLFPLKLTICSGIRLLTVDKSICLCVSFVLTLRYFIDCKFASLGYTFDVADCWLDKLRSTSPQHLRVTSLLHIHYPLYLTITMRLALVIYDHILTFAEEVQMIWRRRTTLSSIIFLLNRYTSLFGYAVVTYFFLNSKVSR